jgi:DNA-binding NarL/FixJ family response regulator
LPSSRPRPPRSTAPKSNKAICRTLDLAEPTVKNHVTAILRALKAHNRTEAVIAAGALGLLLPPQDAG